MNRTFTLLYWHYKSIISHNTPNKGIYIMCSKFNLYESKVRWYSTFFWLHNFLNKKKLQLNFWMLLRYELFTYMDVVRAGVNPDNPFGQAGNIGNAAKIASMNLLASSTCTRDHSYITQSCFWSFSKPPTHPSNI